MARNYVKSGFVSAHFNESQVWLRSTNIQRTLLSALNFVNGMFPTLRSAVVHTEDVELDALDGSNSVLCPRLGETCCLSL
jgi:hypothetical protein